MEETCKEPDHKNTDDDEKQREPANDRRYEDPMSFCAPLGLLSVLMEQLHIFCIGFPYEVECVPDKRDCTDDDIDEGIEDHSADNNFWQFELQSSHQQYEAHHPGYHISSAREEAKQRFQSEPPAYSRYSKAFIHQPGKVIELFLRLA